ncbi:hypothetical protein Tco_0594420, partial [Tanacetum coccineum]
GRIVAKDVEAAAAVGGQKVIKGSGGGIVFYNAGCG